jgi:hypothetical protein
MALASWIATNVGLGVWWKQSVFPTVSSLATLGFTYWWAAMYLGGWLLLCPAVTAIYAFTNQFARLLGYDVRPFFSGRRSGKTLQRIRRRLVKASIKRGLIRRAEASA